MKISIIVPSNSQGLKDYSFGLVSSLVKNNNEIEIVCNEKFEYNIESVKINKLFSSGKYSLINGFKFFYYLYKTDSKILHLQSPNIIIIVFMIVFRTFKNFKIVITPHSVIPHWKRPIYDKLKCFFWSMFDLNILHTKSDVKYVKKQCKQRIEIKNIPHGAYDYLLNTEKLKIVNEIDQIDEGIIKILFFGYIRDDKNLPLLFDAIELLNDNYRNKISLIIAGRNKSSFDIKNYVTNKKNIIHIDRFITDDEVGYIFKSSDVVVLPYTSISESGVLHIAFSQGLPVLATNIDGFVERIQDGNNGLLFDLTAKDIKDKLIKFIEQKEQMQINSIENINNYLETYSWDTIAQSTLEAYRNLK